MSHRRTRFAVTAILAAAALALTGCSAAGGPAPAGSPSALTAAVKKGGTITFWAWAPAAKAKAAAFEKLHPGVTVKYVNAGSGPDEYTKVTNALKAGSGTPDVAQFEYTAMPQFALGKQLVDLTPYGLDSLKSKYSTGPWSSVQYGGSVFGLPEDSGPMAMFYNQKVFDKFGLTVPKTWAEFASDAEKLHAADPDYYLTSDNGDGNFTSSMIWQAGGHPYKVDGDRITIDLQDKGAKKWTGVWNTLIEKQLLAPTPSYTDDWYKQLENGQIASLVSGAWMPSLLQTSAASGSGDWRAAPMPTYDGTPTSANYGGSADAVVKGSKNPALAAAFVKWMNSSDAGVDILQKSGSFPSTTKQLDAPSLVDQDFPYFGGQKVNQVLVDASKTVPSGWQYLPYQSYGQSIYADSAGQSYANHSDLDNGLKAWQKALVSYGNQQGFQVTGK